MNEIEVFKEKVSDIVKIEPHINPVVGTINFDELISYKTKVVEIMDKIKLMKVSYENIEEFKALSTALNKVVNTLDERRKEIKNEYDEPLQEFENVAKELTKIVKDTRGQIKEELDKFAEEDKKEKRKDFIAEWNKFKVSAIIPFEKLESHHFQNINMNKWYNKGTSKKSISLDLAQINSMIEADINSIKLFVDSEKEQKFIVERYCDSLDLNKEIMDYKAYKKGIEAVEVIEVTPNEKPIIQVNSPVEEAEVTKPVEEEKPTQAKYEAENEEIKEVEHNVAYEGETCLPPKMKMENVTMNFTAPTAAVDEIVALLRDRYGIYPSDYFIQRD